MAEPARVLGGGAAPSGSLRLTVVRADGRREPVELARPQRALSSWPARELSLREIVALGLPRPGLSDEVNGWRAGNARYLWRGARRVLAARVVGLSHVYGQLFLTVIRADGSVVDLGLASMRVVTTAGVNFLVDALQNLVEPELLRYHGIGTGTVAEATADTALGAESTLALNPDSTRATGTLTEGASANVFRTVGTNAVDAAVACTEHGVFSQAATGGGTLLDRSVFAVVNLASGESLQSTYDFTIAAGS